MTILVGMTVLSYSSNAEAAKYAGEPFHIGVGARALGMGSAFVAVADNVTSGFWNPAGLGSMSSRQVIFMHSETFGALLNHDYIAFSSPLRSAVGSPVGAVSLIRLGGGGIKLTEWDFNLNRPVVVKESGHADYQLLFSYAMQKTDCLKLGVSTKFVYRDIAGASAFGIGSDFGAQYVFRDNFRVALMMRDVTTTLLSYDTGTKESIYPTLVPGLMYRRVLGDFEITASADADVKFENYREAAQYWQGSISADTRFGFEIGFQDIAFGRIGSDIGRLTLGCGVSVSPLELDVAYMRQTDIDDSFRISLLVNIK